jgi:IclR family acetate operon transcriptional repressor
MTRRSSRNLISVKTKAPERATSAGRSAAALDGGHGTDDAARSGYHVAALTRGLLVLRALASNGSPMDLASLEEQTALPKSTLVRLLSVLRDSDYVLRVDDAPTFWLGPSIMPLANAYTSALDVSLVAKPVLERLAASSGQTTNIGILDGPDVVHLCVVEPNRPVRFRSASGSRDGAHQTGLGKLLLAFLGAEALAGHLPREPFPARTKRTITTRRALLAEVETIRRSGYAFDDEEGDAGVCCLAVPIRRGASVAAALSVAGPAGELSAVTHERYLALLRDIAAELENDVQFQHAVAIARRALR